MWYQARKCDQVESTIVFQAYVRGRMVHSIADDFHARRVYAQAH
ncbi:Hypothetical protein CpE19_1949 [Corynebacterium pseudotuberculosis]|nr:Hypothetical protein CpE19_1949 [Corynebacterium pseudotuberculosis]